MQAWPTTLRQNTQPELKVKIFTWPFLRQTIRERSLPGMLSSQSPIPQSHQFLNPIGIRHGIYICFWDTTIHIQLVNVIRKQIGKKLHLIQPIIYTKNTVYGICLSYRFKFLVKYWGKLINIYSNFSFLYSLVHLYAKTYSTSLMHFVMAGMPEC